MDSKNFVLVGAAGFVAPRHMKAIKETGNNLIAAYDPHDSVGILDSYFPNCKFFTVLCEFIDYCKCSRSIDYISICSPNHTHQMYCEFGLGIGADIICEKPLLLNWLEIDPLSTLEKSIHGKINPILQLRLLDDVIALKKEITNNEFYDVNILYNTPRGRWYKESWKYDAGKSGGLLMNIGIHFIDLLIFLFGKLKILNAKKTDDYIELAMSNDISKIYCRLDICMINKPHRSMTVNGKTINLSNNFSNMHTKCYAEILKGDFFDIQSVKESIKFCNEFERL